MPKQPWRSFAKTEEELLQDPDYRAEFERQAPRFAAIAAMIATRQKCGLTQAELADRMGVQRAAVTRLEAATHSPKIDTLADAAWAMGYDLEVKFKRRRKTSTGPRGPRPEGARPRGAVQA